MVTTCIYKGLTNRKMDRLYLFSLPFGYVGVFLLLYFGTDLSVGLACGMALLIGDAPGAMLSAIIIGSLSLLRKSRANPGSTGQNSVGSHSIAASKDPRDRASHTPRDGD